MKYMNAIYFVNPYYGDYGVEEFIECIVPDNIDPDIVLEKLKKRDNRHIALSKKINDFKNKWREENPPPYLAQLHKIKKWPAGLKQSEITEEMRAERDHLKKLNKEIVKTNRSISDKYDQKMIDDLEVWANKDPELSNGKYKKINDYIHYNSYSIRKIPVWSDKENIS